MYFEPKNRSTNQTPLNNKDQKFSSSNVSPTSSTQEQLRSNYASRDLMASKASTNNNKAKDNQLSDSTKVDNPNRNDYHKPEPKNKFVPYTAKHAVRHEEGSKYYGNYFRNERQEKKPLTPTLATSHSQGRAHKKDQSPSPKQNNRSFFQKQSLKQLQFNKELRQKHPEYQKLHDKLNFLQVRIAEMKTNMQKKRQEKRRFIDNEIRQRQKREQERKKRMQKLQALQAMGIKSDEGSQLSQTNNPLGNFVTQVPQFKELHTFNFNPYSPRHNLYYVSEIVRAYKEDRSLAREHILSSMHILRLLENTKMATKEELSSRCLKLDRKPGYEDKKTIVFDLDQTLIHCNESVSIAHDVKLPIKFPTGEVIEAGVNIRPYTTELLKALSKNFEVIVFTASHSCYANVVLNYLDPENKYIHHRLFREHCYATPEGMYVKDLRVIDRPLSDMVLVDNAAYSYAFQIDNGIPIIPYYQGKVDYELKALQHYLQSMLLTTKDVREINRKTFKISQYRSYDNIETLVKELYAEWLR